MDFEKHWAKIIETAESYLLEFSHFKTIFWIIFKKRTNIMMHIVCWLNLVLCGKLPRNMSSQCKNCNWLLHGSFTIIPYGYIGKKFSNISAGIKINYCSYMQLYIQKFLPYPINKDLQGSFLKSVILWRLKRFLLFKKDQLAWKLAGALENFFHGTNVLF